MTKHKGLWIELEDVNSPGFYDVYPLKMDEKGEWYIMFSFWRIYLKDFPDTTYLNAQIFTELRINREGFETTFPRKREGRRD